MLTVAGPERGKEATGEEGLHDRADGDVRAGGGSPAGAGKAGGRGLPAAGDQRIVVGAVSVKIRGSGDAGGEAAERARAGEQRAQAHRGGVGAGQADPEERAETPGKSVS